MPTPESLQGVSLGTMQPWSLVALAGRCARRATLLMQHPYQRNRATPARMALIEACSLFVENCCQMQAANTALGQPLITGAEKSASECLDERGDLARDEGFEAYFVLQCARHAVEAALAGPEVAKL